MSVAGSLCVWVRHGYSWRVAESACHICRERVIRQTKSGHLAARNGAVRAAQPAASFWMSWLSTRDRHLCPSKILASLTEKMLAIIGGTGMTQLGCLEISHRRIVTTPYGEPSGPLTFGSISDKRVVFLARHGYGHTIPPHEVNYRANLWALHSLNLSRVISVASVGGIRADLAPGTLAIPDQIIDYTHGRKYTLLRGSGQARNAYRLYGALLSVEPQAPAGGGQACP